MRFWGFEVYQASLWVTPGFSAAGYAQSPFALELTYLRDFKGADIAKRSIAEMRRQAPLSSAQESAWETQMRTLFPDVKIGDRITGVHQPGLGAVFWHNAAWARSKTRRLPNCSLAFGCLNKPLSHNCAAPCWRNPQRKSLHQGQLR